MQVIWLHGGYGIENITFAELPGYFAEDPAGDDDYVWPSPFRLTVRGDRVEAIMEQYIP